MFSLPFFAQTMPFLAVLPKQRESPEVDVHGLAATCIKEDVLGMPVPETENVPDHRPHRNAPGAGQPAAEPSVRIGELLHQPVPEHRRVCLRDHALQPSNLPIGKSDVVITEARYTSM